MALYSRIRMGPLIVVLGATGCGKSKLSLELACKFNGEIISADSMQIYKGLDIITNKVTPDEQSLCKHHMLGFVNPENNFTVHDFQKGVLPLINDIFERGKIPVIVGGTHYYLEAILWDFLLSSKTKVNSSESSDNCSGSDIEEKEHEEREVRTLEDVMAHHITQRSLQHVPGPTLHQFLKEVDPERADTLHPNDRRKIIRSLQVYQQTGLPHSQHILKQQASSGASSVSGPLRFQNAFMFWVQCEQEVLNQRLDDRIDDMISSGLLEEMTNFHKMYNESRLVSKQTANYTEGIFQSIGFKEFHKYLVLPEEEKETPEGKHILQECLEMTRNKKSTGIKSMKTVTQQYSKKQIKWINGRFVKRFNRHVPPLYGFDATNVEQWNTKVRDPAFKIIECILKGEIPETNRILITPSPEHKNKSFYCDICCKPIVGTLQWEIHQQSRSHYKRKKTKRLQQQRES